MVEVFPRTNLAIAGHAIGSLKPENSVSEAKAAVHAAKVTMITLQQVASAEGTLYLSYPYFWLYA